MNSRILKIVGPGVLFASTAIGVSHLVQSTRAGAVYGLGLLWAVVLANLLKYPFFQFGSRYASVTGVSIIDGYKGIGAWALWLYILITLMSMFFVCAAVTAVTAGFFDNLFGISAHLGLTVTQVSTGLLISCAFILFKGRYSALDTMIKGIASVLFITTIIAFGLAVFHGPVSETIHTRLVLPSGGVEMAFVIALMGWMPTAVDLSAWNSLWTIERIRQTAYKPSLKETLMEFNIGYVVSAILAIMFLVLGAYLFNGTDIRLSSSGPSFANQVVSLFTQTIGSWSYAIVAASSFAIMLGTCIAVLDGYARAMERCVLLLSHSAVDRGPQMSKDKGAYSWTLSILALGALIIIWFLGSSIPHLVDVATTISFLIAPVIAGMNYYLVKSADMGNDHCLPLWLELLAILGLVYLTLFSVLFLIY